MTARKIHICSCLESNNRFNRNGFA